MEAVQPELAGAAWAPPGAGEGADVWGLGATGCWAFGGLLVVGGVVEVVGGVEVVVGGVEVVVVMGCVLGAASRWFDVDAACSAYGDDVSVPKRLSPSPPTSASTAAKSNTVMRGSRVGAGPLVGMAPLVESVARRDASAPRGDRVATLDVEGRRT